MHPRVKQFFERYGRLPTEFDPDYLEMLNMSKYKISDVPPYPPTKCANCGTSKNDGRKYIDFDLTVDWYGVVYICGFCLKDISSAMGLFEEYEADLAVAKEQMDEVVSTHERGEELLEKMLQVNKEFESFANLHSIRNDIPTNPEPYVVPDKIESDDTGTNESKSVSEEPESGTSKPTPVPRRKNVRSLAELLGESSD